MSDLKTRVMGAVLMRIDTFAVHAMVGTGGEVRPERVVIVLKDAEGVEALGSIPVTSAHGITAAEVITWIGDWLRGQDQYVQTLRERATSPGMLRHARYVANRRDRVERAYQASRK